MNSVPDSLQQLFERLLHVYGPQGWWPADSVEEMMIGSILVQNTAWAQVVKVVAQLASHDALSMEAIRRMSDATLWEILKPVGFFRIKTRRLRAFAEFMRDYDDSPDRLFRLPTDTLRVTLLRVYGIGKETADSMICYGAKRPVFVVDTYGKRLFHRLGWRPENPPYDAVQAWVEAQFPRDARLLGELHALIVAHAKAFCHTRPSCGTCPLLFCPNREVPRESSRAP